MRKLMLFAAVLAMLPAAARAEFRFTITSDPHNHDRTWANVLEAIEGHAGGPGAFHVTVGDVKPPDRLRARIDAIFGRSSRWFAAVGNHDATSRSTMNWLRTEFDTGHGVRPPLRAATLNSGPAGARQTVYSWNHDNAHFVMLNAYWDGRPAGGGDGKLDGNICAPQLAWLRADLEANTQPFTFVFCHEPAFPQDRHMGDSLNKYPANRDALWRLLERHKVAALICGHTHVYNRFQPTGGTVWQVIAGNAGRDNADDGHTFLNVTVGEQETRFDVWRDEDDGWRIADRWTVQRRQEARTANAQP